MSAFGDLMTSGLAFLGDITGQTLQYRSGSSGSWSTLTGGFVTYGPAVPIGFDENRREIIGPMTARLKMPASSTPILVPNTPEGTGYQVRVGSTTVWAVIGVVQVDYAQTVYELRREEIIEARAEPAGSV